MQVSCFFWESRAERPVNPVIINSIVYVAVPGLDQFNKIEKIFSNLLA